MVRVNCAAIPATLIESELFGREKGAYTGALSRQIGRFELADGSTIFLDEIGDLPPDVQVKLLRVLEDKQIERLGSSRATKVDTRIIAATHRDLEKRIEADTFREDLYYRLNVFPIRVPPLRERTEDIPMLVWRFVEDFSKAFGKRVESIRQRQHRAAASDTPGRATSASCATWWSARMIVANGPRLTIALPQSVRRRHATQRAGWPTWRRSTSRACSTAPGGGFAASAAPPSGSGSKPRPSRRAWRSWGSGGRVTDSGIPEAPRFGDQRPPSHPPYRVDQRQLEPTQKHRTHSPRTSTWYVCCSAAESDSFPKERNLMDVHPICAVLADATGRLPGRR